MFVPSNFTGCTRGKAIPPPPPYRVHREKKSEFKVREFGILEPIRKVQVQDSENRWNQKKKN